MRQRLTNADLETILLDVRPEPADDHADLDVLRAITAQPRDAEGWALEGPRRSRDETALIAGRRGVDGWWPRKRATARIADGREVGGWWSRKGEVLPAAEARGERRRWWRREVWLAPGGRGGKRWGASRLVMLVVIFVLPVAAIAGGAGTLLRAPKVDHRIPAVVGWRYVETKDGPTVQRLAPAWLRAEADATEVALRAKGFDRPRCGIDAEHPIACFNPDGTPIDEVLSVIVGDPTANRYLSQQGSAESMEVRSLTPAEAAAWLTAHPEQRPTDDR
jgi:hypothetical protein